MAGFCGVFDVKKLARFDVKILAVCFGAMFIGVSTQQCFCYWRFGGALLHFMGCFFGCLSVRFFALLFDGFEFFSFKT